MGALSPTLDATFFALSDPKRRGILERLGRGPATLSQLAEPSGLTLNGIKKHVGILEFAGLVETEKLGRVRECRLGAATTLGEAGEWIETACCWPRPRPGSMGRGSPSASSSRSRPETGRP